MPAYRPHPPTDAADEALVRLRSLRGRGHISEEEFEAKRQEIISRL